MALDTEIRSRLNPSLINESRSKINQTPSDVISTFELKIISPFFIFCNDMKKIYFCFFSEFIYYNRYYYFFFLASHGVLLNINGMNEELIICIVHPK